MRPRPCASVLLVLLALAAGCGDAPPGGPPAGTEPVAGAEAVLAELSRRVAEGAGISDGTWTTEVQAVAFALWPADVDQAREARRQHTNLAHIAGDMTVQLLLAPDARDAWRERDPLSLEIHDAFVAASRAGVDAYRRWVEGEGTALLERRVQALGGN
jgi:hypothetical protein